MGKLFDQAIADLDKAYGKGTIMKCTEKPQTLEVISSGSLALDMALGVGGYPRGRIIEIIGWESSGKTTLTLHAIAEAHAVNPECLCAFIDAEHALNLEYAKAIGVDLDRLYICQPNNGEEALQVAEKVIRTGECTMVVVDSVAALVPQSEINGDMGDAQMGLQARLMGQAMRKLTGVTEKTGTTLIFINQFREKIGVAFGDPRSTPGGNALKFYASIRMDVAKTATNKDKDNVAASNRTRVKVIKNKVAPPFRECELDILYGVGIDKLSEIIDMGVNLNLIKKAGSWFSYGETKLGQGKEGVCALLKDNPELVSELDMKIKDSLFEVEN